MFARLLDKLFDIVVLVPCRRRTVKFLYVLFFITGGFWCADIASPRARYVWLTISVVGSAYSSLIGIGGYTITSDMSNLPHFLYACSISASIIYTTILVPALTYYCREELKTVLKDADDEFGCRDEPMESMKTHRKQYDSYSRGLVWLVVPHSLVMTVALVNAFYLLIFCDRSCLQQQLLYIEATPFIEQIHSLKVYFTVFVVQLHLFLLNGFLGPAFISFSMTIVYELHNNFVKIGIQLEHVMNETLSNLSHVPAEGRKQKQAELFETFKTDIGAIVKHHQKLTSSIELLRSWMEIMFTVNIFSFVVIQTMFSYCMLVMDSEVFLKVKMTIGLITMSSGLFTNCLIGSIIDDMNVMMNGDIYSTVWYDLPPIYRQTVYILLCQTQQPRRFFAFRMYPMIMITFARTSNLVYAIISLQRY